MRTRSPGKLISVGILATLLGAQSAYALILNDKTPELKFRQDVGKQTAGYLACILKASLKCEKKYGTQAGTDCDLVAETSPATDTKLTFKAALDKCASKVDLDKKAKGLTYTDIGCPGDADPNTAGPQRFTDLQAYQDFTVSDDGTRKSVSAQGAVLGVFTGCSDNASCLNEATRYSTFATAALKCSGDCEADYKNKKGNGGPTDAAVCHLPVTAPADPGGQDPKFQLCVSKAIKKAIKKGPPLVTFLQDAISKALNDAVDFSDNVPGGNCGP